MFFLFFVTECRNLYKNLCRSWSDYCKPEALGYAGRKTVKQYRFLCPVTCRKCQHGQKLLNTSRYGELCQSHETVLTIKLKQKWKFKSRSNEVGKTGSQCVLILFNLQRDVEHPVHGYLKGPCLDILRYFDHRQIYL